MSAQHVTFYYPYPEDLGDLDALDLDDCRFWNAQWMCRRRVWSLRSFLLMKRAGHDVSISTEVPSSGVVLVGPEAEMRKGVVRATSLGRRKPLVVGVRADRPRFAFADAELVQNGKYEDGRRVFHVPHWPQPGLVPRDPQRGTTVQTISFKGYSKNLGAAFSSDTWARFLADQGLVVVGGTEKEKGAGVLPWEDYSGTDLVLAVRPDTSQPYFDKPASKLFNAWHAGAPALLGPEYAYREQRRSELDYIEVGSLESVMEAVLRLQQQPALYAEMVMNGRERARSFTTEAIVERWAEILFERVPNLVNSRLYSISRNLPALARQAGTVIRVAPAASELVFFGRYYKPVVEYAIKGKLRPWLGQVRREIAEGVAHAIRSGRRASLH